MNMLEQFIYFFVFVFLADFFIFAATPETPAVPTVEGAEYLAYTGADGRSIRLINNDSAVDPTFEQAIQFIKKDKTSSHAYTDDFQCGDFAELVHNNAESSGLKCGWVAVQFWNRFSGHACCCFNTTDRGMVCFDCTQCDAIVTVSEGIDYKPVSVLYFDNETHYTRYTVEYESVGIIKSFDIFW